MTFRELRQEVCWARQGRPLREAVRFVRSQLAIRPRVAAAWEDMSPEERAAESRDFYGDQR